MDNDQLLMMTDARELILFAKRNARMIGLTTLGMLILAFVLALVLPARYSGEAIVIIDPRKTNPTNMQSVFSTLPADNSVVRSEMDIIKSHAVINRVIDQMDLLRNPDFNSQLSQSKGLLSFFRNKGEENQKRMASEERSAIAAKLLKNLDVENDGRSYSIAIRYRDRDPARAAQIANSFTDQYLIDQLEVKYDVMKRINLWLSKRLGELQGTVKTAERAVEEYRITHNLVNMGDETLTQQQIGAIDEHLFQAQAERSQALARLNSVKHLSADQIESSSVIMASSLIQQLKQQEALVRRKEADLATRYGDRHPSMIDTRNELRSIREKISEEVRKTISGLRNDFDISEAKVDSLEGQLAKLKAEAGIGNKAMVTLRELERQASANRSLYEGFLGRFKQMAEQQDLQVADSRIIARAEVPHKAYFPSIPIFLAVGAAMGFVVGFLIALLLEHMDRGLRSLSMAEKLFGVSGLGIIPVAEVASGQLPTDYVLKKPLSVYAESIRSVSAAIHFSNVDAPPKVIVVTSSFPGEGKTSFSTSLARIQARSKQKVIVIDADMRRPRVHSTMGLDKSKPDLAMLLAGKATLEQTIQHDISGADAIMARPRTANPQDLIASHQMEKLLATLRERYDMIIIDTPPVMTVADAILAGQKADTTVYVARWSSTPREVVGEGLKKLAKFNIRTAGLVLSQVDLRDRKQYGYDDYGSYYGHYKNYYTN
ncbi:MAG: polysaccharide biosynthesis tyrosine autokinase [Bdellovibrionales bacterium]